MKFCTGSQQQAGSRRSRPNDSLDVDSLAAISECPTCLAKNLRLESSVTRFGEFSPLWQKLTSLWQILDSLFLIWQNVEPTSANLVHYWVHFHCYWCPNIEKKSNHQVTLLESSNTIRSRTRQILSCQFSLHFTLKNFSSTFLPSILVGLRVDM